MGESHPAVRVGWAADPAPARGSPHPPWVRDSEAGGAGVGGHRMLAAVAVSPGKFGF